MMRTNTQKLRGKIAEAGLNNKTMAHALKMNPSTFYRKMHSDALAFTIEDMHRTVEVLGLTKEEACAIFLDDNSH